MKSEIDPMDELIKACHCLHLEVADSIAFDVQDKARAVKTELDSLRTQLKSVEAERDEAKRLLSESKDALHEVAAFGSCDCNIPKGVTCVPCECAMICNQIHAFLNPKPQDVK